MKAIMLKMSVVALSVMTMLGCASTGGNDGPSDEELITALATGIADALRAQDIDAMVSYYSDDFSSSEGGDKAAIKMALEGYKASGFLEGIEVDISSMKVEVDGDKATVGPIDLEGVFGGLALDFDLEKRDGKWIAVYMSQY